MLPMALFNLHSSTLPFPTAVSLTRSSPFRRLMPHSILTVSCSKSPSPSSPVGDSENGENELSKRRRLSGQSSWESKDSEGKDYLYRLGKEADNMNISVGAKDGVIDSLFTGTFLGRDSDIVFDYRQKVTRSFEHLHGDYYIAPLFMVYTCLSHCKELPCSSTGCQSPFDPRYCFYHIILHYQKYGIWGGKGQGKSFQTELIFQTLGLEPVIMSAGELESDRAGEPGRLIRERYRTASQVVQNQGKMSCLMINDLDAGIGRFGNTQHTVNNQIVVGTLMNLSDNPTRVSIGQEWREADVTNRIPIIVTGNDFSTIYAPLIRDGRMDKFYWSNAAHNIGSIAGVTGDSFASKEEVAALKDSINWLEKMLEQLIADKSKSHSVEISSGHQDDTTPHTTHHGVPERGPRFDFQLFSSTENPLSWLYRCELYFMNQNIAPAKRVTTAAYYLTGEAQLWYHHLRQDQPHISWDQFRS
ncbi:Ribulose bisphosphate carboxylase/oxygenase activase, chloroplastic [Linum grandiflorum]